MFNGEHKAISLEATVCRLHIMVYEQQANVMKHSDECIAVYC